MDDKEDRLTINVKKSRVNITLALAIVALLGLMGLTGVIMATYYNDKDSTPTVMNKNLESESTQPVVSPDEQLDEAPEYELVDEKVVGERNFASVHTSASTEKELVLLNDILFNMYKPKSNFVIYYFKDKAAATGYLKDKNDDELLNNPGSAEKYFGVMKYSPGGEKVLAINDNGNMKTLGTFK